MSYPDPAKRFGSIHPSIRIHRKTFKSLRRNCQLVIFQMPAERDLVKVKIVLKKYTPVFQFDSFFVFLYCDTKRNAVSALTFHPFFCAFSRLFMTETQYIFLLVVVRLFF